MRSAFTRNPTSSQQPLPRGGARMHVPAASQRGHPATAQAVTTRTPAQTTAALDFVPKPDVLGTILLLIGLVLTGLTLSGKYSTDVARHGGWGVGLSLLTAIICDLRRGFRNLIRPDLMAMLALYLLTFFELLFQQLEFHTLTDVPTARTTAFALLCGFGGLAIGRHLVNPRRHPFSNVFFKPVPSSWLLWLFWVSIFLSYFHMLLAVNFNPVAMVQWFLEPRFSQPWQRGTYGDWKALLNEFALLLNLIPPLAGIIIARRRNYSGTALFFTLLGFLFTLFYAFSTGTRNVFISYLVTFLIGFAFALSPGKKKELIALSGLCAALTLAATFVMLQFRDVGLKNWLQGKVDDNPYDTAAKSVFVDGDFYAVCRIVEIFPRQHPFLTWEIPYLAFVRPIPRALWPGKPMGLSMTIEDVMQVQDMNVTATFVGEAYISGGLIAVTLAGLFFGALMRWWTHLGSPRNSDLGVLIYASGFFAAVISMRTMFYLTTALLPTVASLVLGYFIVRRYDPAQRAPARPVARR